MTTRYDDILNRLRAATGPDRELDLAAHKAFCPWLLKAVKFDLSNTDDDGRPDPGHLLWWEAGRAKPYHDHLPEYTSSIDAALALVEKMLPGWHWKVEGGYAGNPRALLRLPAAGVEIDAFGPTAPLAILIALFTAQEDSHE